MGYFDIQVNGYGGVDFNQDSLSANDLHQACQLLRDHGVDGILATIITEKPAEMESRIRRLSALREKDPLAEKMICGLHIEGPFLNPGDGYRGAHPAEAICQADRDMAARFVEAGGGLVRVFTLAPEQDPGCRVTRYLREQDVVVSAGHTNASLDQLRAAIDAGLGMFTHLGNGCPMNLPRHDNIIQRALFLRDQLWLCFIADGVHIPFHALRNYLDLVMESGRCLVTTDAMAAAGLGPGTHRIGRWTVAVKDDLAAWAPDGSHLLGSAMSMVRAVRNLTENVGLTQHMADLLTCVRPREVLGVGEEG